MCGQAAARVLDLCVKLLKVRRAMADLMFAHGVIVATSGGTRDDP